MRKTEINLTCKYKKINSENVFIYISYMKQIHSPNSVLHIFIYIYIHLHEQNVTGLNIVFLLQDWLLKSTVIPIDS